MLSDIRIVLVETTHPGNIGGVARAMKNMGLSDLALVSPKIFPSEQATARASGADDLLAAARLFGSLKDAIADCQLVIGASARLRTIAWPELDPRTAAAEIAGLPEGTRSAIVFGREHSGLTNGELEQCHFLLHIASNPEFSSLNLACAVQVVAYELYLAAGQGGSGRRSPPLADGEQMASFFDHLERTLYDIRFLHARRSSPSIMRRLRRIFNSARIEAQEIHLLRGILTAAQLSAAGAGTPHAEEN
ncbi:RNA methyltransferase [Methylococcus capsulatus]|uniref:tRNA (cytidine/uridine-2'-O-)-methyltransferase TrmJ n=1 Tax=Methylococcus capsulatus (strain ATCC 33009 / NCIMB 11132 / Bath) TaxID=243233 RepID=Q604D5_METCA|nr:RNA methyltransferase [Methylococcus capsulatus]AAU91296.1 RNA methyltransferase, TrmH family, group 1 [Methylococcus capsulatus str. Bath]QXP86838.1 RNA methyltransferase [Methylococcus capsulatus]QXP93484.1 RNA methyltransferase [Methylococcus capsulatus]UQN11812.1 RNA methyltransferase [Methylococcus capsulatus]